MFSSCEELLKCFSPALRIEHSLIKRDNDLEVFLAEIPLLERARPEEDWVGVVQDVSIRSGFELVSILDQLLKCPGGEISKILPTSIHDERKQGVRQLTLKIFEVNASGVEVPCESCCAVQAVLDRAEHFDVRTVNHIAVVSV